MTTIYLNIFNAPSYSFTDGEFYCVVGGRCFENKGNRVTIDQFLHEEIVIKGTGFEGSVVYQAGVTEYKCELRPIATSEKRDWENVNSQISIIKQVAGMVGRWLYNYRNASAQKRGGVVASIILGIVLIVVATIIIIDNQVRTIELIFVTTGQEWDGCTNEILTSVLFTQLDDIDIGGDDIDGKMISDRVAHFEITTKQLRKSQETLVFASQISIKGNNGKSDTIYFDYTSLPKTELTKSEKHSSWNVNIKRQLTVTELIEKYRPLWAKLNSMEVSAKDVEKAKVLLRLTDKGVSQKQVEMVSREIVKGDGLPNQGGETNESKIKTKIEKLDWFFKGLKKESLKYEEITKLYHNYQRYYFTTWQRSVFYYMTNDDTYKFERYKRNLNKQEIEHMTFQKLWNMY